MPCVCRILHLNTSWQFCIQTYSLYSVKVSSETMGNALMPGCGCLLVFSHRGSFRTVCLWVLSWVQRCFFVVEKILHFIGERARKECSVFSYLSIANFRFCILKAETDIYKLFRRSYLWILMRFPENLENYGTSDRVRDKKEQIKINIWDYVFSENKCTFSKLFLYSCWYRFLEWCALVGCLDFSPKWSNPAYLWQIQGFWWSTFRFPLRGNPLTVISRPADLKVDLAKAETKCLHIVTDRVHLFCRK